MYVARAVCPWIDGEPNGFLLQAAAERGAGSARPDRRARIAVLYDPETGGAAYARKRLH